MSAIDLRRQLLLAELNRRRRPSDHERYVETFRRCAIDPNPHQVEAVAFALGRLSAGGALLADEVGLGKTIETGLLLTQLRAEGKTSVLILVPLSLARQWQVELQDLFGLKATVLGAGNIAQHTEPGLYIVGRELAGSPNWAPELRARGPWDLIVVDEAHEVLSGLYRRYGKRDGSYIADLTRGHARRAGWLKFLMADTPALLLTATPLQNTLYELWSLVQFVDRGGLLGHFGEFTHLFSKNEGRALQDGTENDLRARLQSVMVRTLRSQAQPFLQVPFTARRCETINFHMQAAERDLYEAVSTWLRGRIAAYPERHKRLIATTLRKKMGSSVDALAASLVPIRKRLTDGDADVPLELVLEDERELARFEALARAALAGSSPKLEKLGELVDRVRERALQGVVSDKMVIFTESRPTLATLAAFLREKGETVTTFSGQNESPEAAAALAVWEEEVGANLSPAQRPDRSAAVRAALVHEFRTRTRILLATEAGAKGLNLQFCNCLVNFDLPWNPQRIEQRIGRVHRYGQRHDVVVVNFINLDNEGEERVYQILRDKLQLFSGLFGASDPVLGAMVSVLDFERRVHDLLLSCRTPEERRREFDRLELELDHESRRLHEARLSKARDLMAGLDAEVRARLKLTADELPLAMSRRDELVLEVLECEAPVTRLPAEGSRQPFEWKGKRYHLGPPAPGEHFGEPFSLPEWPEVRGVFEGSAECSVYRLTVRGLETEEQILVFGALPEEVLPSTREWKDPPELEAELTRRRGLREVEQEAALTRRLALLRARRLDMGRLLDAEETRLENRLEEAQRRLLRAATTAAAGAATRKIAALKDELAELRAAREERLEKSAAALRGAENELARCRYVTVEVERLFQVVC